MTKILQFCVSLFVLITSFLNGQTKPENLKKILNDFEEIALIGMKEEKIPGMAIGIVLGDEVVYLKGFGVRKEGNDAKVDPDTVFQVASVTKPITGSVIAALVSQGKISWDDKIKLYIPNFKVKSEWVTDQFMIRDALSHRSGLRSNIGDELEDIGYSLNDIIERLQYANPVSSFRTQYAYQNMMITIGALAAANAVKKDFNLLAKEVLFAPLDMHHTGFFFKDYEKAQNRAYSHVKDKNGNWVALYTRQADVQFGGGGVSSTVRDLCNWMIMYLNKGKFEGKQVISEEALFEAHAPQILRTNSDEITSFYAMGIVLEYNNQENYHVWNHAGAFFTGILSLIYMLPEEKLGLVVLTNVFPSGLPAGLAQALNILYRTGDKAKGLTFFYNAKKNKSEDPKFSIIFSEGKDKQQALSSYEDVKHSFLTSMEKLGEKNSENKSENNNLTLPLERYVGTYKSFYYDLLDVKKTDDGLEAYIGKHRVKLDLKPIQGHTFAYEFLDTSKQPSKGFLTFEVDNEGNVQGAQLTGFKEDLFEKNQ